MKQINNLETVLFGFKFLFKGLQLNFLLRNTPKFKSTFSAKIVFSNDVEILDI